MKPKLVTSPARVIAWVLPFGFHVQVSVTPAVVLAVRFPARLACLLRSETRQH